MINHARTLLLNTPLASLPDTAISEYVPVEFVPVPLSGPLQQVQQTLFGSRPTGTTRLLRVRQYLALWHAGRFADYVQAVDPRITYDPFEDITAAFVTVADVTNKVSGIDPSGVLFPASYFPIAYFQVAGAADVSVAEVPDARVILTAPNPDMQGAADVAQVLVGLANLGEANLLAVFGLEAVEPLISCRAAWATRTLPVADRLGAFLTAYSYRLHALREQLV